MTVISLSAHYIVLAVRLSARASTGEALYPPVDVRIGPFADMAASAAYAHAVIEHARALWKPVTPDGIRMCDVVNHRFAVAFPSKATHVSLPLPIDPSITDPQTAASNLMSQAVIGGLEKAQRERAHHTAH